MTKWCTRKFSQHPFRREHSEEILQDSNRLLRSAAYQYHQASKSNDTTKWQVSGKEIKPERIRLAEEDILVTKRLISSDTFGVERQGSRQYNMQPVSIQPYYTGQDVISTRSIQPQVSIQRQSSVQPQLKYKWGSQYSLTQSLQPDYIDQADFKASLHEQIRRHPMRLASESIDIPDDLASTSPQFTGHYHNTSPTKSKASSKRTTAPKLNTHSEQVEVLDYDTTDDEDARSDTSNKTAVYDSDGVLLSPEEYRRRKQTNLDVSDGLPPPPAQPPLPPAPSAPEPPKLQPPPPTKRLY